MTYLVEDSFVYPTREANDCMPRQKEARRLLVMTHRIAADPTLKTKYLANNLVYNKHDYQLTGRVR